MGAGSRLLVALGVAAPLVGFGESLLRGELRLCREASAQTEAPSLDVRTFSPSPDPSALFATESPSVPDALRFALGAWASYALRPVALRTAGAPTVYPIENGATVALAGSLGVGARTAIGFMLPAAFRISGEGGFPSNVVAGGSVPGAALGDLAIRVKTNAIDGRDGGFGLAVVVDMTLPTGNVRSFDGEGQVTGGVRAIAEYTFLAFGLRAATGVLLRPEVRYWPQPSGAPFGNEVPWVLGAWVKPAVFGGVFAAMDADQRQTWELSFRGALPAGPLAPFASGAAPVTPVLVALADRVALGAGRDFFTVAAVDVGLTPDAVGTPVVRAMLSLVWAPEEHDQDGDGVRDDVDQCKEIPGVKSTNPADNGCPAVDAPEAMPPEAPAPTPPGGPSR